MTVLTIPTPLSNNRADGDKRQMTDDGGQMTEGRGQPSSPEGFAVPKMTEDRRQRTEGRGQGGRSRDRCMLQGRITKREFLKLGVSGFCALWTAQLFCVPKTTRAKMPVKGLIRTKRSPYFTPLDGGKIQCDLCPRLCHLPRGKRGFCRVRENRDGELYTLVYGNCHSC